MRLIFSRQTLSKPNYSPWFGWLAKEKGTQARGLQNPLRDAAHSQPVSRCPARRVLHVPVKNEHVYVVGVISVSAVGRNKQNRHLCLWRTKTGLSGSELFLRKCPRTSGSEMTISARWEVLGTGKCRGLADALARWFTVATSRRPPTPLHPTPTPAINQLLLGHHGFPQHQAGLKPVTLSLLTELESFTESPSTFLPWLRLFWKKECGHYGTSLREGSCHFNKTESQTLCLSCDKKTATHDKYIELSHLWCHVFSLIIDLVAKINTDMVISI